MESASGPAGAETWVGVRALAREASARLGRAVAASTVTRAVQDGRLPSRAGARGPEIPLERGLAALRANTDPVRALGPAIRDGRGFDLGALGAAAPAGVAPVVPAAGPGGAGLNVNTIKTAQAALALQNDQLDFAERQGRVAVVEPLRTAFVRRIAALVGQVEVGLPDAAAAIAAATGADPHVVNVALRRWWRKLRADMARTARAQGEALPELVDSGDDGEADAPAPDARTPAPSPAGDA